MAKRKNAVSFLKKDPMKTAGKTAAKFAIRGGSAIAARAGSNLAKNIAPKFHAPALMLIGLAGEVLLENEYARAAAEGIGTYGAMKATEDFIPETSPLRQHLGLGATDGSNEEIEIDSTPNWDALAEDMDFEEIEDFEVEEEGMDFTDDDFAAYEEAEDELETLSSLPI
jgi:hypothetical protein